MEINLITPTYENVVSPPPTPALNVFRSSQNKNAVL